MPDLEEKSSSHEDESKAENKISEEKKRMEKIAEKIIK